MDIKDFLPLLGVLIGGLVVFSSNYFLETRRYSVESKRLAFAFRGEVQALITLVEKRRYIEGFQKAIEFMEKSGKPFVISISVRQNYFPVFTSNVNKIGMLRNYLPELIARFYLQASSVLEDLEGYRDGSLGTSDVAELIELNRETLTLFQDTLLIGESITKEINQLYYQNPDSFFCKTFGCE